MRLVKAFEIDLELNPFYIVSFIGWNRCAAQAGDTDSCLCTESTGKIDD